MVTGSPSISRKMPTKSSRWNGRSLSSALSRAVRVGGEDHLAHGGDALVVEEHVLGAAEADALGAEVARGARVERRVGVGAHAQRAHLVGPHHELAELAGERGGHGGNARRGRRCPARRRA